MDAFQDIRISCNIHQNLSNTIQSILGAILNIYDRLELLHTNKEMLLQSAVDNQKYKIKECENISKKYLINNIIVHDYQLKDQNQLIRSSIDATKIIDWNIKEFIDQKSLQRIESVTKEIMKFSGVDRDLERISKFLELVGNSKIEYNEFDMINNSFKHIQDYIFTRGKCLQIISSKQLASKMHKIPVMKYSTKTQTNAEAMQIELQESFWNIEELKSEVENKDKRINFLNDTIEYGNKERETLRFQIDKLKHEIENTEHDLKLAEDTIFTK